MKTEKIFLFVHYDIHPFMQSIVRMKIIDYSHLVHSIIIHCCCRGSVVAVQGVQKSFGGIVLLHPLMVLLQDAEIQGLHD